MQYEPSPTDIAVIGMACRFPGAANPSEFWRNIRDGKESVSVFSDEELLAAGVSRELLSNPDYVKAGVVLDDIAMFDAGFFGFSPKDAAIMDPQHRHFLECSWEALEHAGYTPEGFPGAVGVFAGCGMNAYFMFNLLTNPKLVDSVGLFLLRHTGNDKDFLSTRVSYCLNLRGPSINVQTACSTSLVAIHTAAQSLLNGECNLALAGGVTIEVPHHRGYLYQDGEILSRDGHCRAFDHRSTGTIFGSGAGVVVLRRLSDALESGDTIHAILRGSAINNDGSQKVGYLAPSVDGQAAAVAEALAVAGVDADSISYIAAHGTATAVGDPIEVSALTQAFRRTSSRREFCAIGSVKTNIGHLDTAAGVASFILTVEALKNKQLPPSLHFERPNPLIDFASSPFYVNAALKDWPAGDQPRRAGVSSLGVGGTNAHCVLEEAPSLPPTGASRPVQLLTISARSKPALDAYCRRFAEHLKANPDLPLVDVAFTSQMGRRGFRHRRFVVAPDVEGAVAALESKNSKTDSGTAEAEAPVIFMFPGGGAQYPNMGLDLYRGEPVYRRYVDQCLAIVQPRLNFDLRALLFPEQDRREEAASRLEQPLASILAIFITEYALAQLWISWGVRPKALTGHSLGEYTAACLAGILSLEDALSLVVARGLIFEKMPQGAMLSIQLPEAELRSLIDERFDLSVINTSSLCVVSGNVAAIEELERSLQRKEIECTRVRINVAAHSRMLDPYLPEFAAIAERVSMRRPEIPVVSNLTGKWMDASVVEDRQYWVKHLRGTVRFSAGMELLLQEEGAVYLEVGPGSTLTSLVRQHAARKPGHTPIASMRHPKEAGSDYTFALSALGRLWASGGRVEWQEFWGSEHRRRVPLPTYPFEHQRFWIEPGKTMQIDTPAAGELTLSSAAGNAPLLKQPRLEDWIRYPRWVKAQQPESAASSKGPWLIYTQPGGWGSQLAAHLRETGQAVVELECGNALRPVTPDHYIIDTVRESFNSLVHQLIDNGRVPRRIVHCLGVEETQDVDRATQDYFHSLVFLTQALAEQDLMHRLEITVITRNLFAVDGTEPKNPLAALALGPARVIPQEFPGTRSLVLDIDPETSPEMVAPQLKAHHSEAVTVQAMRGDGLWALEYTRGELQPQAHSIEIRKDATYLITGGFGGAGLTLAHMLAKKYQSSLILLSRTPLPPKSSWAEWIEQHGLRDSTSQRITQIRQLEAYGSRVAIVSADVTDEAEMRRRLSAILPVFGPVHGVIHTAGTIDDQPVMVKTFQSAEGVLAPKVKGTLALARVLAEQPLEFFLSFSSTSALLGLAGQVDYTAANAFLDAYAAYRRASGAPYVSVNWGVWNGVGMAARAMDIAEQEVPVAAAGAPVPHPMLGFRADRSPTGVTFAANWNETLWVLDEHRLHNGAAFLPGTGYIEMIRAAAEQSGLKDLAGPLEIRDLSFEEALYFGPGDTRLVWITLKQTGDHWDCLISSLSVTGSRRRHAHCEIRPATGASLRRVHLESISRECSKNVVRYGPGEQKTRQEAHLQFGPRWKVLRVLGMGEREAFAELELPQAALDDLATFRLHPALLDLATGFALPLLEGYAQCTDLFVPLFYRTIRYFAPLKQKVYSHARLRLDSAAENGICTFDVSIYSEFGEVLVEVEEFAMRLVANQSLLKGGEEKPASRTQPTAAQRTLQDWVKEGITPAEGAELFERVLRESAGPQVIASPLEFESLVAATRPVMPAKETAASVEVGNQEGDPIERGLLQWWQELLGVSEIGLDDDFFELGGYSLVAVRLFAKIKRAYKVDMGIASLFEHRTVRTLAEAIRKQGHVTPPWSSLVPMRVGGKRPPLFLVHGIGGNVLGYSALVKELPEDLPIYALQSLGLDGKQEPLTTMQEIAEHYIREIQKVQPSGPYYLGGYSFGGVAAYEMAQQLVQQGQRVALLVMIDSDRPNHEITLFESVSLSAKHLFTLSPVEQKNYIARKLEAVKRRVVPPSPSVAPQPEKVQREVLKVVREANFKAHRGYHAKPYPGSIVMMRAAEVGESGPRLPDLGWKKFALGGMEIHTIPGNHINIYYDPNVKILARFFTDSLYRSWAEAEMHEDALRTKVMEK